jgi:hypothetical protein
MLESLHRPVLEELLERAPVEVFLMAQRQQFLERIIVAQYGARARLCLCADQWDCQYHVRVPPAWLCIPCANRGKVRDSAVIHVIATLSVGKMFLAGAAL